MVFQFETNFGHLGAPSHLLQEHDVEVAVQKDVAQGAEPWLLVEAEGPVQAPHVEIQHAQAHLQIHTWLRFKMGLEISMSFTPQRAFKAMDAGFGLRQSSTGSLTEEN